MRWELNQCDALGRYEELQRLRETGKSDSVVKRWSMRNRRNDKPPIVFEADRAAIERMIDAGSQQ